MPKKTATRLLCEDYVRKFDRTKHLTLAKKIVDENKGVGTVEYIRTCIRSIVGSHGKKSRKNQTELTRPLTYNTTTSSYKIVDHSAKILVLDIETAPIRAYVWGIWQQNVNLEAIQSDWFCLTWAAKWLFEKDVKSAKLTMNEVLKENDGRIIKQLWQLVNQADMIIAHNGVKFDMPKLNSRFIFHKLNPPLPYQQIDTLVHIRKNFGFSSNKLDYVNKILSLPRKLEHEGMELWVKCMKGDTEALARMEEYNRQDVLVLEETYLRIRAWIKPHPNLGLHILDQQEERCPSCGSNNLKEESKDYHTTVNVYEQLRCNDCGAIARKRKAKTTVKERRFVLSSSPK